jgi:hypothetical protein
MGKLFDHRFFQYDWWLKIVLSKDVSGYPSKIAVSNQLNPEQMILSIQDRFE